MNPPIIFACGMIRSGSTALYQLASEIVEMHGLGERCGYYEPPVNRPNLPEQGIGVVKVPWMGQWEFDQIEAGAIGLYSYRDIEESLASAFRAFEVPPRSRWFWRFYTEGYAKEMQSFEAPTLYRIPFELIRDDLAQVIGWLGVVIPGCRLTRNEIAYLADEFSLERQKARPKVEPYDPETLLFAKHFN